MTFSSLAPEAHTRIYKNTDTSCVRVLHHLRKLVANFIIFGGEAKRECKWVQTAGAFLVARSDGGPQGLAHQPLVLLPLFRQKPTGEKAGRPLRQRDQMVREVKSAAHSVSATLSVTWATVLMPVQPTGVWWAWGAVLLCRAPLLRRDRPSSQSHSLSHTCTEHMSVSWLLPSGLWPGSICLGSSSSCATLPCIKINVDLYVYKCPALANRLTQHWSFLTELKE